LPSTLQNSLENFKIGGREVEVKQGTSTSGNPCGNAALSDVWWKWKINSKIFFAN
jgi:hypothetical protein